MQIFVINCGSSSIKYQLIAMPEAKLVCSGLVERIGTDESVLKHKVFKDNDEFVQVKQTGNVDHGGALAAVVEIMMDKVNGVITSADEIHAVGHRVLHGGKAFSKTIQMLVFAANLANFLDLVANFTTAFFSMKSIDFLTFA